MQAGIRRKSETLTAWIGVSRLLRQNCLHEIADFIVASVASGTARDFGAIVFCETSGGLPLVQPEAMRTLDRVPQSILAEVSETGRVNKVPRMLEPAIEAAARAGVTLFFGGCVDYFNAQSELRKGRSLRPVRHHYFTLRRIKRGSSPYDEIAPRDIRALLLATYGCKFERKKRIAGNGELRNLLIPLQSTIIRLARPTLCNTLSDPVLALSISDKFSNSL